MNARTTAAHIAERPDEHARIIAALLDQAAPERRAVAERFLAKADVRPDGCWNWRGARNMQKDYGRFSFDGRTEFAHRVAHELFIGPIPAGLTIDHLCRNHLCVRPDHLEAVTSRVNTLRGVSPAAVNARKTHCKNGHEFDQANTYWRPGGGRSCRRCHAIRTSSQNRRRRRLGLAA
jgi:hypothetical protein